MADESKDKTVNFEELKKKLKWEERKRKAKEAFDKYIWTPLCNFGNWAVDNPGKFMGLLALTAGVTKRGISYKKEKAEQKRRDTHFYDPRTGDYGISKRPLTDDEYEHMMKLYRSGLSKREALIKMGLSKDKR